ncbi:hypothetical protein Tco_0210392, partial [Tanacetum coccineum]
MQQPLPNNNFITQSSFNTNYMQQPMPNPEDITDPTTTINMALVLIAKAFKLNDSTPTNNNQIISSNPRNRQIAQSGMNLDQDRQMQMNAVQNPGIQNVRNHNGFIVVPGIANQHANQNGNGNVVATWAEGNGNRNNRNQQASTSGTQTDSAPVYDSDGSADVLHSKNCYDNDILNMFTQEEHVEQSGGTVEQNPATVEETLGGGGETLGGGDVEDESMKNCFGGMMVIFGFFDGLEMEAFGEAMEVDNDWAIAGEMLEFLDTFGIVGFSERYNRVNIVEDERLEWSKDFNKAMLIDVVEASVKVKLHNTHGAGSSDCPQCLHTGRYAQWRSRFLRYIDTKTNGDALRKCILDGPYIASTVVIQVVPATKNSLAVLEHTTVETILNISPVNKAHFVTEMEAILYSGPEQAQKDKEMQKKFGSHCKVLKKLYKPNTTTSLETSSNTRNKNVDTTPRYKNDNQTGQFGNQRAVNVVGARDTVGGQVVQQSGIQSEKCVQLQAEQSDWLANTDEEIDEQELEAHYSYMAKIQEVPNADSRTDSELLDQVQYDTENDVFSNEIQHFEQSESISNTCVVKTDDSNVILDSP